MTNKARARWMVVDDDAETLDAVARLLAYVSDAEIVCFRTGHEAVRAFAFAPESFQLVFTDFEMPRMNGVDVRRHMHALSPSLPVILTTGGGMFTEEMALRSGFCALLHKPFSLGALKHLLDSSETRNGQRSSLALFSNPRNQRKDTKMKTTTKTMLALLALGASAFIASAQDGGGPPPGDHPPRQGQGPGGGPGMNGRRPVPPLMGALDANHDGVIDSAEIANAPAALKQLDKNGDGQLTQEELRPPRPQGGDGQGRPPGGGGQGRPPGPGPDGQPPQHPPSDI